jgi:acetoin utilization deacetylase AcuC-like enzyme
LRPPIVWHDGFVTPLRDGHRFPMSKYGHLRAALAAAGWTSDLAPAPAGRALLAAVHESGYVDRVLGGSLTPAELRWIGLPGTPEVARRAMLSAGATLLAGRLALAGGLAMSLAGGSHHAGPEGGAGYCVFNDVAVAARALLDEGAVRRILIVDCDVHQGDGTARIFARDPRVFTLSLHAERNYPARKARSSLDVGLPDGTGDAAYMAALDHALDAGLAAGRPGLAFYNAGVDVAAGDRLGRLALSPAGILARDRLVLARLAAAGVPVATVLGGGYGEDPAEVAGRHALLFAAAESATATGG